MSSEPGDRADVFARFGLEIIRWAGFHTVRGDARFAQLFHTLFELETETCAKTLASFKCALRPEHRDFCFFAVRFLKHAALRTPRVDPELLQLLLERGAVRSKSGFFEVIKPFDQCVMRLQDRLLRSVTPLLMACNAYELGLKTQALGSPLDLALALETTNALCRKSLALLGQTFALASAFRQEKILEALGLRHLAPSPAAFPNLEDSALFGREYVQHLRAWLLASGCALRVRGAPSLPPETQGGGGSRDGGEGNEQDEGEDDVESEDRDQGQEAPGRTPAQAEAPSVHPYALYRADPRIADAIDQLVNRILGGGLSPQERAQLSEDPNYWFLLEERSLEHRYYVLKLAQEQRNRDPGLGRAAVVPAVRAVLCARAVRSLKRRLLPAQRRLVRGFPARRTSTGTQTRATSTRRGQRPRGNRPARGHSATSCPPDSEGPEQDTGPQEPQASPACPSSGVDARTLETVQKLARFVAQVGPEMEQFSIDNSADNPDLWFLHDRSSAAFRLYRRKVLELCPSIAFPSLSPRGPEDEDGGSARPTRGTTEAQGPLDGLPGDTGTPAASRASLGAGFPRKRVSSKSLRVGLIPAPKRLCLIQEPKVHEPVRIAYDRPRGQPVSNKKKTQDLDFAQQKLTDKNLGFQMLQKMGWKEGLGLGSCGAGIREPVSVGTPSEGAGLGAEDPEQQEDSFDAFRQRMMRLYRTRRASK